MDINWMERHGPWSLLGIGSALVLLEASKNAETSSARFLCKGYRVCLMSHMTTSNLSQILASSINFSYLYYYVSAETRSGVEFLL